MKVLIAEDSPATRLLLESVLQNLGYTVISAEDGLEAWDILCRDPEIRFIITDLMMPHMDGMELCQRIRARPQHSPYVYVIILTGYADEDMLVTGMNAGTDDFLSKPIHPTELGARLRAGQRIIELELRQEKMIRQLQETYDQICVDLKAAAKIQRNLLPPPGHIERVQFDWRFYPSNFVAGDIFNCFLLGQDYVGFYQLDVAGHGVSSALLSFSLYHHLSPSISRGSLLDENNRPLLPARVLAQLNHHFQSPDVTHYFTMIYGYLHMPTGHVRLAQAGHPPLLVLRRDGRVESYGEGSLPLGIFEDVEYEDMAFMLGAGERLFMYSDGLIECDNNQGEMFSQERLRAILENKSGLPLEELLQILENELVEWRSENFFADDMTFLALEYT